eukprot:gene64348-88005_t
MACGTFPALYGSLTAIVVLQTLNGWFNGMGWPPCGKTMVHWWSTKERGVIVSIWNVAHNVGGGLVAKLAAMGVLLFHDWGAKFYVPAAVAALCAVVIAVLLRDTPQSCGLPPIEQHRKDYPADYSAEHERTFTFKEIFFSYVLNNKFLWAIAVANAFVYFVRYGVVDTVALRSERVRTSELALEHAPSGATRLLLTAFRTSVSDLISLDSLGHSD